MRVLKGKKILNDVVLSELISGFDEIAVDVGTGDGRFVYKQAKLNPQTFYIGMDPAAENMMEYASKIAKKPSKGGLVNALYVVSNLEDLPDEMYDLANQIYINLPWGSLLEGVSKGRSEVLDSLVKLAKAPIAQLDICFTYSVLHEAAEMERRDLPPLSLDYINEVAVPLYNERGITVKSVDTISNETLKEYDTQWSKRLGFGRSRDVFRIRAEIEK